jgi:hypothetical protein
MDVKDIYFKGKIEIANDIKKDLEEFVKTTFGDTKIKVEEVKGKIFITPAEKDETLKYFRYPGKSSSQKIDIENSIAQFRYNGLDYYVHFYNSEE